MNFPLEKWMMTISKYSGASFAVHGQFFDKANMNWNRANLSTLSQVNLGSGRILTVLIWYSLLAHLTQL